MGFASEERLPGRASRLARSHFFWVVLLLGAFSSVSVPFRYDAGNSGRYLLGTLQAADPELFPGDDVVESLGRFRSLFYDSLGAAAAATELSPDGLETVLHVLYVLSRALLALVVMGIARSCGADPIATLALGVWSCFTKGVPVGGDGLFNNVMTHGTVGFLLGGAALWSLLAGRRLVFWTLMGLAVFVHPLMTLHLATCVVPAHFFFRRRVDRVDGFGILIFVMCLVAYAKAMAPPAMSAEEARIFLAAKGEMQHVSLRTQGLLNWLKELLVISVALFAWRFTRGGRDSGKDLLAAALLAGSVVALVLSWMTIELAQPRWVQFQPLRSFVWVHFFGYTLIGLAAVRCWRRHLPAAPALMAIFVFSLIPSLWQYVLIPIAILALVFPDRKRIWTTATWCVAGAVVGGWLARGFFPSLETLHHPLVPLLGGLTLAAWHFGDLGSRRWRARSAAVLLTLACALSAISWHRYYDQRSYPEWGPTFRDRVHADWDSIRRRIAAETPKEARVLVAGGPGNFRTRALRVGLGEPMSALAWVDPQLYQTVEEESRLVAEQRREGRWHLDRLAALGTLWDADFLLTDGAVEPGPAVPRLEVGNYRLFDVSEVLAAPPRP